MAVEPAACPSLTKGRFAYDFGDTAKLTPLIKMYTLGHDFVPPGIHAGGLRYHGASPSAQPSAEPGQIEAKSYTQLPCFEAAVQFARTEGILPAPESSHAIRAAVDEALAAREEGQARNILFCLSGHGHFDLASYESYSSGKLTGLRVSRRGDMKRPWRPSRCPLTIAGIWNTRKAVKSC